MQMKKYAVVTGASSGIGLEFARILAKEGYGLVLAARRKDRLEGLKKQLQAECEVVAVDLSKERDCFRLFQAVKGKPVEVWINNAGFGNFGAFRGSSLKKELEMVDVNVKALHILTKLALRKMEKQKGGFILNVASCAGLMPAGPYMSTYYASKAYAASLTRGIAEELRQAKSPVYIGCLCPGPVNTEFNQVANVQFALHGIGAAYCARYAYAQMRRRKVVIVPKLPLRGAMVLGRFLPQSLYIRIAAYQQKKKKYGGAKSVDVPGSRGKDG